MRYCPELPPPGCCCQARGNTIVFKMFQQLHSRPSKASGGPPVMTFKAPARTCLHQFEKADAADHSKAAKKCQKMYCTWCKHVQTFRFWYSALPCVTLQLCLSQAPRPTWWCTSCCHQLPQGATRQGRQGRWLQHHAAAGSQGWCHLEHLRSRHRP